MRNRNYFWLAAAVLIAGCGSDTQSPSSSTTTGGSATVGGKPLMVGVVFDSGGVGDKSFNDSANRGAEKAKSDLGAQVFTTTSKTEKDYQTNMEGLIQKGCNVIFAIGYKQEAALKEVAPKHPDVNFAIVDDVVDLPNVRSIVFDEEQGSFLAGYLAALMSKTGKVGFVGGETGPLIKKFEAGYVAGAKTANPKIDASGIKYTENWDDTSTGKMAAQVLFNQGCDVVYHAAGKCGLGVISAAKDAGKYAIGVDSDQDWVEQGTVLTSMVKHVDTAVFDTVKDIKDGKFKAGTVKFDLKSDGVGLTEFKYTKDKIGDANLKKLADEQKQIVDGKVTPPATDADLKTYLASIHAS